MTVTDMRFKYQPREATLEQCDWAIRHHIRYLTNEYSDGPIHTAWHGVMINAYMDRIQKIHEGIINKLSS